MAVGLALQAVGLAWMAMVSTPTVPLRGAGQAVQRGRLRDVALLRPGRRRRARCSAAAGAGQGVGREQRGAASWAAVFGVAVLAGIFTSYGGYGTSQTFIDGLTPAFWIGASVVALSSVAAFLIPQQAATAEAIELEPAFEEAA